MWLVLGGLLQFWVCHIIAVCESLCSAQEQVIVCTPDVRYFPRQAGGFRVSTGDIWWSSCSFNLILLNSQDTGNTSPWNIRECRAKQRCLETDDGWIPHPSVVKIPWYPHDSSINPISMNNSWNIPMPKHLNLSCISHSQFIFRCSIPIILTA